MYIIWTFVFLFSSKIDDVHIHIYVCVMYAILPKNNICAFMLFQRNWVYWGSCWYIGIQIFNFALLCMSTLNSGAICWENDSLNSDRFCTILFKRSHVSRSTTSNHPSFSKSEVAIPLLCLNSCSILKAKVDCKYFYP